jgi:putative aldouronate transport system permease protein
MQEDIKMSKLLSARRFSPSSLVINLIFMLFSALCVIPVLIVLSISFTPEQSISTYGYHLIPKALSLNAYKYVLGGTNSLLNAYSVTIAVTVVGTILHLFITSMLAYSVSRNEVRFRNQMSFFVYFTILFNGGLVPYYILITKYLHLKNTFYVLVLIALVSPVNIMIMKNFFKSLPDAIIESARIDGSGEFRTFISIVLPLSKPSLATIGLFVALGYWNDWFTSALFIENQRLYSLQYLLQSIMNNVSMLLAHAGQSQSVDKTIAELPTEGAKMATCILSIGPIIVLYPSLQKYFVKGLTLGAVKS